MRELKEGEQYALIINGEVMSTSYRKEWLRNMYEDMKAKYPHSHVQFGISTQELVDIIVEVEE